MDRDGHPPRGADLARRFWREAVEPLLDRHLPGLACAAGRLETGSDVLGLDDATSRDHDWGLRLTLLVPPGREGPVQEVLEQELPATFAGHPVRFALTGDPRPRHRVDVTSLAEFATRHLGTGPDGPTGPLDWLALTGQAVLEVTAGPVFRDDEGTLTRLRERLRSYPEDVHRYALACDWQRLDQELPLVGRTADVGDDLGSRLLTARLVRVAVHLGFPLHRRWPPYAKWAGTLFARLPVAAAVLPALEDAVRAGTGRERQAALGTALDALLDLQRALGLPAPPAPTAATLPFHDRPHRCVHPDLVPLLLDSVRDPAVRRLPAGVGAVEQWVDDVDVLVHPDRRRAVTAVWREAAGGA
ncbi:DUF4037 domain-containing protein [Kineococcus terrestris]|uniref:DUF4037 domain-containing protein n=1 Tax=Kineococcus terrestris TaxID=2044856 RepID=UPI0034DAD0DD